MHPIFFTLGPVTIYSYGIMMVIAFLATTYLTQRAALALPAPGRAMSQEQIMDFSCVALLGGLLGARAFYVALNWQAFAQAPADIVAIWHGGLVWYGGFAGGIAVGWLYTRAKRLAFLRVLDLFIPFLALGHAIGRIGCFLNGCCYGKPTEAWCGVVFPGQAGPVLPTQLFEAAGLFLLFLGLKSLQRPSVLSRPGRVLGAYLISYGVLRFLLEPLRGDQPIWWAGLTLQQLISIGMIIIGFRFLRLFRLSVGPSVRRKP